MTTPSIPSSLKWLQWNAGDWTVQSPATATCCTHPLQPLWMDTKLGLALMTPEQFCTFTVPELSIWPGMDDCFSPRLNTTFPSSTVDETGPAASDFDSETDLSSHISAPDTGPWMVSFDQLMLITTVLTLITGDHCALGDDPRVGRIIRRERADWAPKPFVDATEYQSTRMQQSCSRDLVAETGLQQKFEVELRKLAEHLDELLVRIDRLVTAAPYLSALGFSIGSERKLDGNAALQLMCHSLSIELVGIAPDFEAWSFEADETCSELSRLLNLSPLFEVQQIDTHRLRWSVDALQSILRIMSPAAAEQVDVVGRDIVSNGAATSYQYQYD